MLFVIVKQRRDLKLQLSDNNMQICQWIQRYDQKEGSSFNPVLSYIVFYVLNFLAEFMLFIKKLNKLLIECELNLGI